MEQVGKLVDFFRKLKFSWGERGLLRIWKLKGSQNQGYRRTKSTVISNDESDDRGL